VWAAVPLFLLSFPGLVVLFNLCVFRFPYSVFGAFGRTPLPAHPPAEKLSVITARIGWLRAGAPFLVWHVYPEGLGFTLFGVGKGFVPRELIRSVTVDWWRVRIEHGSPEVRGPIFVPARVADALDDADPEMLRGAEM